MPVSLRRCALGLAVTIAATAATVFAQDTQGSQTKPNPGPTTRAGQGSSTSSSADEVKSELTTTMTQLKGVLGDLHGLQSPTERAKMAQQGVPLAKKMLAGLDELGEMDPRAKPQLETSKNQFRAILVALGDPATVAAAETDAKSPDPAKAVSGKTAELTAQWFRAGHDAALQSPIVDNLATLDAAHADSVPLTMTNVMFAQSAASVSVRDRLLSLASDTMKNPAADAIKRQVAAMKAQQAAMDEGVSKMKEMQGKPLAVAGTTVDGKQFTTADWKGKVVLVDFWATWCPPCRAELPQVKQIYSEDHAKGLEILGVSNDYAADTLKDFTAKESMPWPQLFDSAAAAEHGWNPVTLGYGIDGIPAMFLIDRKGILRSVEGREDLDQLLPKLLAE